MLQSGLPLLSLALVRLRQSLLLHSQLLMLCDGHSLPFRRESSINLVLQSGLPLLSLALVRLRQRSGLLFSRLLCRLLCRLHCKLRPLHRV